MGVRRGGAAAAAAACGAHSPRQIPQRAGTSAWQRHRIQPGACRRMGSGSAGGRSAIVSRSRRDLGTRPPPVCPRRQDGPLCRLVDAHSVQGQVRQPCSMAPARMPATGAAPAGASMARVFQSPSGAASWRARCGAAPTPRCSTCPTCAASRSRCGPLLVDACRCAACLCSAAAGLPVGSRAGRALHSNGPQAWGALHGRGTAPCARRPMALARLTACPPFY